MKPPFAGNLASLVTASALCAPGYARGDVPKFPSKPITYIVPVTPGTGTGLSVHLIAKEKDEPSAEYPGVPTLKELYNLPYPMVITIITQKAVPDAIVKKLDDAFAKAMKEPPFISGMKELRLPVIYRSGKDLDPYVLQSYNYSSKLLKEMGAIKRGFYETKRNHK
jgi:tripartite-type tricarboxylate transporter receptor subunit TctC